MNGGRCRTALLALFVATATACANGGDGAAPTATTQAAQPTVTTPPPSFVETQPEVTTEPPVESEDPVLPSTSAPAVLESDASGRSLTLDDVFATEGSWEESRYDIADRRDVEGIGVTLRDCGDYYAAEMELRLARNFKRLTMNVGQANDSPSSDDELVVAVIANGRQEDTRRIPFDRIQPFTIDVNGVNALKLRLWIEEEECTRDDVIAVVEKLTLYG